jgi:general secretion pathway protein N
VTKWHPATKLLLLAAVLAVPYLLWTRDEDEPPAVAASAARPAAEAPEAGTGAPAEPPVDPFVLPPLEWFTAVVERPLFSPTRRLPVPTPPAVAEAPVTAPEPEPVAPGPAEPELRFFGTVRENGAAAALVTYPATAEVARLAPGDAVGEWRVVEVERNRLVLGLGGERRSFEIFGAGSRAAAGAADDGAADEDVEPEELE